MEKAEDYKVEQPEGTEADGGEEFLRSFDFVDVKVDELSWDDIIPKDQLEAVKAEEQRKADERYLADIIEQNKPRVRNTIAEEREERQAKRQQRNQTMDPGSDSEEGVQADPKRPLSEREYRYLIKGHLRYGSIDDRTDEFLAEARLRGRDIDIVKVAMQEIFDRAASLVKEEQERMDALGRSSSRTLTKKDKKAVLFEHHGVKRINAETILERPEEMRLLQTVTSAVSDPRSFRIPDATKGAGYSCNWGAREDGMLCVGIARHGYGAWEKIRDDPELGLSDKLFLEEHRVDKRAERERQEGKNAKSPGAVHLVRRADYLISVLKGKVIGDPAAKKAVENHHRNNKKNSLQGTPNMNGSTSYSASPVPSSHRKAGRESEKQRQRALSHGHRESMERHQTPKLEPRLSQGAIEDVPREKKHRHHRHKSNEYQMNGAAGSDAGDEMLRLIFRPVRESLKIIQSATKSNLPDAPARANILREHLRILGNFVKATVEDGGASLEGRLW